MHFETSAIRATRFHDAHAGAVAPPIYLSTTFERLPDGTLPNDYLYSRTGNPNRNFLENALANLEGAAVGIAFGSGMAAITALLQSLRHGDHLIASPDAYYAFQKLVQEIFVPMGISVTWADTTDIDQIAAEIRPETRMVWVESPSNPLLKVSDIEQISKITRPKNIKLVVDNTWATPVLVRPLALGADAVMHATTKYFGGHSDVLGGALLLRENDGWAAQLRQLQNLTGGVPSPFDCWLVTRGIQTLSLRVKAQSATAMYLAEQLRNHPKISKVHYPGLAEHPQYTTAKKQFSGGFGGMFSVEIHGDLATAQQTAGKLKLFTRATSLGGVESLVEHRKPVEGPQSSTPDNLLRVSVGLEHPEDLLTDWHQALSNQS